MAKIFISYRREDAGFAVDQVHAALKPYAQTPGDIFIDVDNIPPGVDFVDHLAGKVSQCEIMLVAIGLRWQDAVNENGVQRLHDPNDFVRIEIESALARGIPVVPVLIGGAAMPTVADLPESLHALVRRQAVKIERGAVQQAVDDMMRRMGIAKAAEASAQPSMPPPASASAPAPASGKKSRVGLYALLAILVLGVTGTALWGNDIRENLFGQDDLRTAEPADTEEWATVDVYQWNEISDREWSTLTSSDLVSKALSNSEWSVAETAAFDGDAEAATIMGLVYGGFGNLVEADHQKAVGFSREGCDKGQARGCNSLALWYANGRGVTTNHEEAARLFREACDGGVTLACNSLAIRYANGEGVPQDYAEAVRFYRMACENDDMMACGNLGRQYKNGQGVAQDFGEAVRLFRKACDGGNMPGCNNLGIQYKNGKGVPQDYREAVRFYRKACDGGTMSGCNNLGYQYKNAEGVPQDIAEAIRLYRKACDGGNMPACSNLGVQYEKGEGVTMDLGQARELYDRACDGGNAIACDNLTKLAN